MLTQIRLENFKVWSELDLELGNITLLFGANSSGKTSVLDALLLLKQTVMGFDRHQPMNLGGGDTDYVDLGSYRDLVFGQDEDQQVGMTLEWYPQLEKRSSSMSVTHEGRPREIHYDQLSYSAVWRQIDGQVVLDQLHHDLLSSDTPIFVHVQREGENFYRYKAPMGPDPQTGYVSPEPPKSCYVVPLTIAWWGDDDLAFNPWIFNHQFEIFTERIAYLGPLRSHPQRAYHWTGSAPQTIGPRGEKTIDVLLTSERDRSNGNGRRRSKLPDDLTLDVSKWLAHMGLVSEFKVVPIDPAGRYYETRVRITENGPESALVDVGFGVSQVLPVITLLFFAPEGSIILLEQPELHLHPGAQAYLADLFLHVAETRNLQLIVESHSEHLLRRLQRRIAEREHEFATPEHIKMYFCESEAQGAVAQPVEVDEYGQIANWPEHFFGDISGDLDALTDAALNRRRQELMG